MNSLSLIITIIILSFQFVQNSNKDYIFDLPDISLEYEGNNLNAYKSPKNDEIINDAKVKQYANLRWISIGSPRLIQKYNETSLAHFTDESISFYFKMLTHKDKIMLKDYVRLVKEINVTTFAFVDLEPNSLECSLELYNKKTKKNVNLFAKVNNFRITPYELIFRYPEETNERLLLEERIKRMNKKPILIDCKAKAGSSEKKTNTFKITVEDITELGLVDKLFGDADEAYVTRDQLTKLSQEISSSLNVVEDYQIKEDQFSTKFVDDLIGLPFKIHGFEKDLEANVVKEAIENNFKIDKSGSKSHLRFDNENFADSIKESAKSESVGGKIGGSYLGISANIELTAEFANNNKERWIKSGKNLDDQLKEINKFNENKIEFSFKGEKIYPKSLKVIKIQSSSFKKDLNFKRIKNVYYEYNSTLHFSLSSIKYTNENEIKELRTTASTKTTTLSTIASTSITPSLPSPPKLSLIQTLIGHTSYVRALTVLQNGNLVSGSVDSTIKIWNPTTGALIQTLTGHPDAVVALTVLHNGNLVSGSADKTIKIWNPTTGALVQTLTGHTSWVEALAVLQNGNLVSSSQDKTIKIWNTSTGALIQTLTGHTDYAYRLAVLQNGNLVSGSGDKTIKIWNPTTGELILTLTGHTSYVVSLTVLHNGYLVSGSYQEIKIWNSKTGEVIQTLDGHTGTVLSLTVLQNGNLVSGSIDSTIKIWNPTSGTLIQTLTGHTNSVQALTVLPNGNLVSSANDNIIKIWN